MICLEADDRSLCFCIFSVRVGQAELDTGPLVGDSPVEDEEEDIGFVFSTLRGDRAGEAREEGGRAPVPSPRNAEPHRHEAE